MGLCKKRGELGAGCKPGTRGSPDGEGGDRQKAARGRKCGWTKERIRTNAFVAGMAGTQKLRTSSRQRKVGKGKRIFYQVKMRKGGKGRNVEKKSSKEKPRPKKKKN